MSAPTRQELAEAILVLSDKKSGHRLVEDVAAYLVANRRTGELDAIMREVARLREQRDGVTEVTATSAHRLNEAARQTIKKLLGTEKLTINEVVDAEVVGGVRLETSELLLDLTVRNRLNQLTAAGK
jgi:F0F1-type ATP synthase delta subunit